MEDGSVTVSRANGRITFPAKFMLVAAKNPCPCGYFGDRTHNCKCNPGQILRYQKKISGPMLDRIDIHLDVPAVKVEKLAATEKTTKNESSKQIRKRVQAARDLQLKRFRKSKISSNSEMSNKDVKKFCPLSEDCISILKMAVSRMNLSARSYYRTIKLARTISDLEASPSIKAAHIAESLQYRPKVEFEF
jgi:magnesium chelatase family protein